MSKIALPLETKVKKNKRRFPGLRTIFALMMREISSTNGRSAGGYLWAILEPIGGIFLLTLIFSLGFRSPPLGDNFAIFYASGLIPFLCYNAISGKMATALMFSKPLLAYPTVTFIDALVARFLVGAMTQYMVAYILFTGILVLYDTKTTPDLAKITLSFAMASSLAVGVGMFNSLLFAIIPPWQQVWSVLNRPMFLIAGIIFLYEGIPQPYRDYLWYNPLMHITGMGRAGFYPTYEANYVSPLYVFGISFVLMLVGLFFQNRYYRDLLYR